MYENLLIKAENVFGNMPNSSKSLATLEIKPTQKLALVFSFINFYANSVSLSTRGASNKIKNLFILCHGYAGTNPGAQMSMDAGGSGLNLCVEKVRHSNVAMWENVKSKVENIIVYSCAAANTEPENVGTRFDGQYLMGALAIHTNANVYASNRIQRYRKGRVRIKFLNYTSWIGTLNLGAWEGELYRFTPDGKPPNIVSEAPRELGDFK